MATIRDVAKLANTSTAAVSAVLNNAAAGKIRVGAETRARIVAAARELGYTTHRVARNQALGRTGAMGLVYPYVSGFVDGNPFCTELLNAITRNAIVAGYNLMLHTSVGDVWNGFRPEELIDTRVDGLLLVLPDPNSSVVAYCHEKRIPYVALVYSAESAQIYTVNADDRAGGRLATEHLLALGHRRIAHLTGDPMISASVLRCSGYRDAMRAAGIEPDPEWLVPSDFDDQTGYAAMQQVLAMAPERRPSAVFCANDLCAAAAIRAVRDAGLSVPGDMAVVGYDDTDFAAQVDPPLTSVRLPLAEMGAVAVDLLNRQIRGAELPMRQYVLPSTLSVRASTTRPG